MPFLVSWPGHVKPGVYDKPVIQLDLNATALTAAGVAIQPDWKLDGVEPPAVSLGHECGRAARVAVLAVRQADGDSPRRLQARPLRHERRHAHRRRRPARQLAASSTTSSDDIGEAKDLAAAMPDKVKELQAKWDAWNKDNVAPLWGGGGGRRGRGEGQEGKKGRPRIKMRLN